MTTIFLDLETTPNADGRALSLFKESAEKEKAEVKAPGNYKDETKIADYIASKHAEIDASLHERVLKTSFDGGLGNIATIGVAVDDEEPKAFYVDTTEPHKHEREILAEFYAYLKTLHSATRDMRPVFVGHNIIDFDLRFLFQRSVVLGIQPPAIIPFSAKPWDDTVYDTMKRWAGFGDRIKLDALAKALGLEGKQGMDGSMVWPTIVAGEMKRVAQYCCDDVTLTRDIYRRMTFQSMPIQA